MAANVQEQKKANMRISEWDPENESLWNSSGKAHAMRNLWISIPCLLCGFAVWLYWSIIIVQMQNLAFPFWKNQLYTLTAVAGFQELGSFQRSKLRLL